MECINSRALIALAVLCCTATLSAPTIDESLSDPESELISIWQDSQHSIASSRRDKELLGDPALLAMLQSKSSSLSALKAVLPNSVVQDFKHSKAPVKVSLKAVHSPADVSSREGLKIKFTATNPTGHTLKLLKRETPFEGLWADLFDVHDALGTRLEYQGPMATRRPPERITEKDFVVIPPHGHQSVTLNLSGVYSFPSDGHYFIRLNQPIDHWIKYLDIMSAEVEVEVIGSSKQVLERDRPIPLEGSLLQASEGVSISFGPKCSAAQQQQMIGWSKDAVKWLNKAQQCTVTNACNRVAKRWFGRVTQDSYAFSVGTPITRAIKRIDKTIFVCGHSACDGDTYAFVYASDKTQRVNLCQLVFEDGPIQGATTVIHELTHFNYIGVNQVSSGHIQGEEDFGYGEAYALRTAKKDSAKAMNNADNIAYFVRDVGRGSGCLDENSQCPAWVAKYSCESKYTIGGKSMSMACPLSCKICKPIAPEQDIKQEVVVKSLTLTAGAYTGTTKQVYELAYAISIGVYDPSTKKMKPHTTVTSSARTCRRTAAAPANANMLQSRDLSFDKVVAESQQLDSSVAKGLKQLFPSGQAEALVQTPKKMERATCAIKPA